MGCPSGGAIPQRREATAFPVMPLKSKSNGTGYVEKEWTTNSHKIFVGAIKELSRAG
jgi:hypothetical protein